MVLDVEDQGILAGLEDGDFLPEFRAVSVGDHRRGIRLERIYWDVIREMASEGGLAVGEIVKTVANAYPDAKNVTSMLRTVAMKWALSRLDKSRRTFGSNIVNSLVLATPAPAIALGEDKKLVAYNQPFLAYVQSRFAIGPSTNVAKALRFALDVQVSDLIGTLNENGNQPVNTGFALGLDERRVRGRINVLLAPALDSVIVLGFLASG